MPSMIVHHVSRSFRLFSGVAAILVCPLFVTACGGQGYEDVFAGAFEGKAGELGLFEPWQSLSDQCGSNTDKKSFLRSYTHENYLWYDEVEYIDPSDRQYSVAEYFDRMKTFAKTPSGGDKDPFHFSSDSVEYIDLSELGELIGYGLFVIIPDEEVIVLDTEPNSPAARNGISRGARIVSVEGRTFAEAANLEAWLYPGGGGRAYEFEVRDRGSATTRTLSMEAEEYIIDPVRYVRVIDTDTGPVGYLFFIDHSEPSELELIEAIRELAQAEITDLVLDIRYNGGGILQIAIELASMIASRSATSGRIFNYHRYNDKQVDQLVSDPFVTTAFGLSAEADIPLPNLNLNRVFILTTNRTCSASEAVINGLRGVDVEVVLIGDTTCGKPYGFTGLDNCGVTYFTIEFQVSNDKDFGAYADGFSPQNAVGAKGVSVPGCAVVDDYEHALGDKNEAQLAAALRYRIDGSCPAAPSGTAARPMAVGGVPGNIGLMVKR